ncbi:MAG TPA: hypothetical protein VMV66_01900 [Candidatus Humimicrobiaceae bacterium]|nr:hypothetical protein [Candidatus Humimicrobiaceae bacterium]
MAKESEIRKKAVQILEKKKWLIWWPSRAIFKQNDIFGIFDLICLKKKIGSIKFVQLTTLSNLSTRRKKIKNFLEEYQLSKQSSADIEVWGWDKRKREFKIELI